MARPLQNAIDLSAIIFLSAGIPTFYWLPIISRLKSPVQLFDAARLALFPVPGAKSAGVLLYTVAALAGASFVVIGQSLDMPSAAATLTGALVCLGLLLGSLYRGWHLPRARSSPRATKVGGSDAR